MNEFLSKFEMIKSWAKFLVVIAVGLMIASILFSLGVWLFIGLGVFVLCVAILSIWIVPTGYAGYKTVLGKLTNASYADGLHLVIPYITDTFLMDIRVITKSEVDTKKVLTRNNIAVEYTITYQLNPKLVHLVYKTMGTNYYDSHIHKWLDANFDTFVSKLTYPQLQTQKGKIEEIASKLIAQEIERKCSEISAQAGITSSHEMNCYSFKSDDITAIKLDENGSTEEVPLLELIDYTSVYEDDGNGALREVQIPWKEHVVGENYFLSFDLKINKVIFESAYEEARAKVAVAKAAVAEAEQKKQEAIVTAEGQREILRIKAEGEAEAIKLTEGAKNEKIEELAKIYNLNPILVKKVLAEHFPTVFGGAQPMINLDQMVNIHPIQNQ